MTRYCLKPISMLALATLAAAGFMLAGCAGQYIPTVGDQVAPAGGEAAVVVRLQRSEFWVLTPPVKGAAIQMRVHDRDIRGAYTDDQGYAAAAVPVPSEPAKYQLVLDNMDKDGVAWTSTVDTYVWEPNRPVIAVDVDCLPTKGLDAQASAAALNKLAETFYILYLTPEPIAKHGKVRVALKAAGMPDGPVLMWSRQYWRTEQAPNQSMPKMIVERRMVSPLPYLRKQFPNLVIGLTDRPVPARAYLDAGMRVVLIGRDPFADPNSTRRSTWADLSAIGP